MRRKEDLVDREGLGVFAARRVQLGLFQMYADQDVTKLTLDAQGARRVQADLSPVGGAESALRPSQGQQILGQRVRVLVVALAVPGDAHLQRPLGLREPAVLDLDGADRVQHGRVEVVTVCAGERPQPPGDLLGALVVARGVLGVGVVVEHAHEQSGLVEGDAELFGLRVPETGLLHRTGQPERIRELGPMPDLHVRRRVLVEQLYREHGVLEALRRVAEMPVDVGPDQMRTGLQLPSVVVDGPLVDLPDAPCRRGDVAAAHQHVRLTETGAGGEELVAERDRPLLVPDGILEGRGGVPEVLVLDLEQGGRQPRRIDRVPAHPVTPFSLRVPSTPPGRG